MLRNLLLLNEKSHLIVSLLKSLQVILILIVGTGMTVSFTVTDLERCYVFIVLKQACIRVSGCFILNLRLLGHEMLLNFGLLFALIGNVW